MIGSTVLRVMSERPDWHVNGTVRNAQVARFFSPPVAARLIPNIDIEKRDDVLKVLGERRPDVVINCAGITKHKPECDNLVTTMSINALFPHRLAADCELIGARLIHISTDCVFSGKDGNYTEASFADADDVYGRAKTLGEVVSGSALTLRTSTIGHELDSQFGLLDWFLAQGTQCKGFARAVFSGLPTVVFAQVIRDIVIARPELRGLYHVAAAPINKFDLLTLIAEKYQKRIEIMRESDFVIDRSLSAARFTAATGYVAPAWPALIDVMHAYK
jgi:dTDP-4-dehydrorhamnose reductase